MLEQQVDLRDVVGAYPICITTNGFIKSNGENVMGRGCALELKQRWPAFPRLLGDSLKTAGNMPVIFDSPGGKKIITFPVKHNWWEKADLELIVESAEYLQVMLDVYMLDRVYLPRPGCGNGWLDWETQVKPAIENILDDRVVVTWK